MGSVLGIYFLLLGGLLKQAALAYLASVATAALFAACGGPGIAMFWTIVLVLPIYLAAAIQSFVSDACGAIEYIVTALSNLS